MFHTLLTTKILFRAPVNLNPDIFEKAFFSTRIGPTKPIPLPKPHLLKIVLFLNLLFFNPISILDD